MPEAVAFPSAGSPRGRPTFSVLVALDPDRSDPATLEHAVACATRSRACLTLMCVWRPSSLLSLVVIGGQDPDELWKAHERVAIAWFRARAMTVPRDISLRTLFLSGRLDRHLVRELRVRDYDELVIDRPLSERALARVTSVAPGLTVDLVGAPHRPLRSRRRHLHPAV